MKRLLFVLLLLSGCGGGGGSNSTSPPVSGPPLSGWTQLYGSGATGASFTFPAAPGSVHYVVEPPPKIALGQTITLVFQITGSGAWGFVDPNDAPGPPRVSLLLWEKGDDGTGRGVYEAYREWHYQATITGPGTYTLSAKLDPSLWHGVSYLTPTSAQFQQLLNNLYAVGFTFGGGASAGHGIYSASGSFGFKLISYTVQ